MDIISTRNMSRDFIEDVLEKTKKMEPIAKAKKQVDMLKGKTLATLFFEPSTRTKLSFMAAMNLLGGTVVGFDDLEWSEALNPPLTVVSQPNYATGATAAQLLIQRLLKEGPSEKQTIVLMNLISQIWAYEGVPFGVGRPELVGTLPEYRRRGLVREQFDLVHQWSAERGELVQVITGIPYYYRQFDYELALNLGGGRMGYAPGVTALKDDEEEPYHLRAALETDLALIAELYELGCKRSPIAAKWDMALWRHELLGKDRHNINMRLLYIIEDNIHNGI